MTGPLRYPLATRWSLSRAAERFDEFGEAFPEWALKQMVEIAVEIVIDLLL
jgi:hypothetical protein